MDIKQGQIWREVDPRFERFVKVEDVSRHQVSIRGVVKDGQSRWIPAARSRSGVASPDRFNGKRGGYELFEDAAQ